MISMMSCRDVEPASYTLAHLTPSSYASSCPYRSKNRNQFGHQTEEVHLPCHETDGFDDGWLNDFFPREDAPSDGIWTLGVAIGAQVALLVDDMIGHQAIGVYFCEKQLEQLPADKELEIGLNDNEQGDTPMC